MNPDDAKHLQPAFPAVAQDWKPMEQEFALPASQGMSLRDYFAAKFAAEYLAISTTAHHLTEGTRLQGIEPGAIAQKAYLMADAMLAAREA